MTRKIIVCIKYLGRRRSACLIPLLLWIVLTLVTFCWLGEETSRALLPPPPPDQSVGHFRRSTDLQHYLDNIQLLIEPSSACSEHTPVVIIVTSAPSHAEHRQVIRSTWGRHQHTYFILGLEKHHVDETLADNYVEAKQFRDLIVYDMHDHYQNLTLKTMLMVQWTLERCPQAKFMMKTDDDVLVNPWTLKVVLEENPKVPLLGYRLAEVELHRDTYNKWFLPRWLHAPDRVPEYLSGTAYIVNGNYLQEIFNAAKNVPLINLEDIYLTYLVSKSKLNLSLVHDRRLNAHKPWISFDCLYWTYATLHSFTPSEMNHAWDKMEKISKEHENDSLVCGFYKNFLANDGLLF